MTLNMLAMGALALTLAAVPAAAAVEPGDRRLKLFAKKTVPMLYAAPPRSFEGQHFTNAYGCTYSRTQAPGYSVVWILQVNSRKPGCPNEVPGN